MRQVYPTEQRPVKCPNYTTQEFQEREQKTIQTLTGFTLGRKKLTEGGVMLPDWDTGNSSTSDGEITMMAFPFERALKRL